MIYKNIDIHLIKIKDEQVEKDPFKRKVSDAMMEELAEKLGGTIFEYKLNRGVENILQKVIEWEKPKESKSKSKSKRKVQN